MPRSSLSSIFTKCVCAVVSHFFSRRSSSFFRSHRVCAPTKSTNLRRTMISDRTPSANNVTCSHASSFLDSLCDDIRCIAASSTTNKKIKHLYIQIHETNQCLTNNPTKKINTVNIVISPRQPKTAAGTQSHPQPQLQIRRKYHKEGECPDREGRRTHRRTAVEQGTHCVFFVRGGGIVDRAGFEDVSDECSQF